MHKGHIEMLPYMAAFAVVVETGSFIDASTKLGVSASAVSRQISKLERALSLRLLERSTRQLKVNEDGAKIYSHCKALLHSSSRVFELKDELVRPQGLIRVSAPKMMNNICNQLIPEFLRKYPDINVQFIFDNSEINLISSEIDLSIRITDSPPLGLIGRKLFKVGYTLCASPDYIAEFGVPLHPADLAMHSCIVMSEDSAGEKWEFKNGAEKYQISVKGRYCSNDSEAVLEATLSNLGLACLPVAVADLAIKEQRLHAVLPSWDYVGVSQGMAWLLYQPNKQGSQKLKVMVDYLLAKLYCVS
ncbi:LysR family transcriptional regulator [Pseudomonas sp. PMCC200344]|uniref:LysR family transcriptional regulator n=1 Tax=Pseudomonas sp. PMCC200344 TaxID=3042028 RepID=UPI0024B370F1|nr:LysR family transcriptional regulator [Pseudomonas sp. PMCC200344]